MNGVLFSPHSFTLYNGKGCNLFQLSVPPYSPFLPLWQFCHLNLTKLLQYLCVPMLLSMQLSENIGTNVAKIKNSAPFIIGFVLLLNYFSNIYFVLRVFFREQF